MTLKRTMVKGYGKAESAKERAADVLEKIGGDDNRDKANELRQEVRDKVRSS